MPDNYAYPVKVRVQLTRSDGESIWSGYTWEGCEQITNIDMDSYLTTGHNKPYYEHPVFFIRGNSLYLIPDAYTNISACELIYIKYPKRLIHTSPTTYLSQTVTEGDDYTTTSELPITEHQKIVNTTVTLLLENIESPRIQTQPVI